MYFILQHQITLSAKDRRVCSFLHQNDILVFPFHTSAYCLHSNETERDKKHSDLFVVIFASVISIFVIIIITMIIASQQFILHLMAYPLIQCIYMNFLVCIRRTKRQQQQQMREIISVHHHHLHQSFCDAN